ncbi:MAG: glycosyltransferase family 2 protein [Lachnospiraceae bacterium]|jgi:dolichol-phosphate mannosyltransferase|nr:glycosyltransferase family 2 protein [Lachnospiraceae bacterium]
MSKLSIIVPIYFNEANIPPFYQTLKEVVLGKEACDYEIIFVDDGSTDNSFAELQKLRALDNNVKIIKLARNFGGHEATITGFAYATGDCLTVIASDLQDPLELIVQMFEKWQAGAKVVLAERESRKDAWHEKLFAALYYRIIRKYALPGIPKKGFDAFMLDKQVYQYIIKMSGKNSNINGLILWCGFPYETVLYERRKREIGKSRWTFAKKLKTFIDTLLGFSYVPIRLMSGLGLLFSLVAFAYAIWILVDAVMYGSPIAGWPSMMVAVLGVAGIQLIFLGVIGEYLWRNLDEARQRPLTVVEQTIGIEEDGAGEP